ncbi:MAG: membrane protease YdiL (CAAX protease family) [Cognaticolwellia sp.]|jgi:membrane protease YdiL (CAAX protease family)
MALMLVLGGLTGVVADTFALNPEAKIQAAMPWLLFAQGTVVGGFVFFRARQHSAPWSLTLATGRPQAAWLIPLVFFAGFFCNALLLQLSTHAPGLSLGSLERLGEAAESTGLSFWIMALSTAVVAPVYEELLFRGYVFRGLSRSAGPGVAIGVSALLFAAFHGDPLHAIAVLPMGLFLGWLRWRTGSIWPSMIAHALNNAVWVALAVTESAYQVSVLQGVLSLLLVVGIAAWAGRPSGPDL